MRSFRWFVIVWTYLSEEHVLSVHATRSRALRDFHEGRARSHKLVHGGSLRVDECRFEEQDLRAERATDDGHS